jgi:putative DNA primase/helicase
MPSTVTPLRRRTARQREELLILDPADPLRSARKFVQGRHVVNGVMALLNHGDVFYGYRTDLGAYAEYDRASVRADLYTFLEAASRVPKGDAPADLVSFQPTKKKVDDIVDALAAFCNFPTDRSAPCWLTGDGPEPSDVLAFPQGLLLLSTRELLPPDPRFFTVNSLSFAPDKAAPKPVHWQTFVDELWPGDQDSQNTLAEWFGYCLTPRTNLQKILMIVGPKRSGKGTIARVLRKLLGARNVCGPTLANLGAQFGLQVLIGKSVAIIADARIGGRSDVAVITERLLSISGEDTLSVPRKFLPDSTGPLSTRFLLLTNELPKIEDISGALASRFLVLALRESFYGREDHNLFDRFVPELPGILNWAIDGWDRLRARGRFVQPATAADMIRQFEDLGSPIAAFLRDCCDVGSAFEVTPQHLFDAWKTWCSANGRDKPGTLQTFGRNLRAALPWLGETFPRIEGARVRFYQGLRLLDRGDRT